MAHGVDTLWNVTNLSDNGRRRFLAGTCRWHHRALLVYTWRRWDTWHFRTTSRHTRLYNYTPLHRNIIIEK